jgi:hypothetical protein
MVYFDLLHKVEVCLVNGAVNQLHGQRAAGACP